MNDKTKMIVAALDKGPIRAFGGLLCDANMATLRGLSPIDIHHAGPDLLGLGIVVERTDSGGSPTWDLAASSKPRPLNSP
jgi:hypothetical protein